MNDGSARRKLRLGGGELRIRLPLALDVQPPMNFTVQLRSRLKPTNVARRLLLLPHSRSSGSVPIYACATSFQTGTRSTERGVPRAFRAAVYLGGLLEIDGGGAGWPRHYVVEALSKHSSELEMGCPAPCAFCKGRVMVSFTQAAAHASWSWWGVCVSPTSRRVPPAKSPDSPITHAPDFPPASHISP